MDDSSTMLLVGRKLRLDPEGETVVTGEQGMIDIIGDARRALRCTVDPPISVGGFWARSYTQVLLVPKSPSARWTDEPPPLLFLVCAIDLPKQETASSVTAVELKRRVIAWADACE